MHGTDTGCTVFPWAGQHHWTQLGRMLNTHLAIANWRDPKQVNRSDYVHGIKTTVDTFPWCIARAPSVGLPFHAGTHQILEPACDHGGKTMFRFPKIQCNQHTDGAFYTPGNLFKTNRNYPVTLWRIVKVFHHSFTVGCILTHVSMEATAVHLYSELAALAMSWVFSWLKFVQNFNPLLIHF